MQADIPAKMLSFLAEYGNGLEADFTIPFINQSVCNVTFLGHMMSCRRSQVAWLSQLRF